MRESDPFLQRYFPWLLFAGILLNVPALWLDIIEPDGALYATIAKHIAQHNDWVNLWGDGHDWLDKPHFPFWMAALSFKIFGISSFAYKLPAFIFWLAGLRYTYLVARELFNADTARIAVLISAVALHSTLANFDVRAEPYLTTCIIAAIWYMLRMARSDRFLYVVLAALFSACAIMTKGLFALLTIWGGSLIYWIISKQLTQLFRVKWIALAGLSILFLLPELYSLYIQFDLHPEKVVFGKTGVSGLRFFFWDSQFGRFFNTGPIRGKGNVTFFLHTTLWAFLPWSLGLLGGVFLMFKNKDDRNPLRWVIYGSALLTFILFSLSKFQLPHYIVILFPHFSMIAAFFYQKAAAAGRLKVLARVHFGLVVVSLAAVGWLVSITGISNGWLGGCIALVIALAALLWPARNELQRLLQAGYAMAGVLYSFLFFFFYPFLFQYQSGMQAARHIPETALNVPQGAYGNFSYSFEFYAPGEPALIHTQDSLQKFVRAAPVYLYTNQPTADSLRQALPHIKVTGTYPHYPITRLKYKFLNKNTRDSTTENRYLLYIPAK